MLTFFSLSLLIKYYWIIAPLLLCISGELTIITFFILYTKYSSINYTILLINSIISAFSSEQILFLLPKYYPNKYSNYKEHWVFKKIINKKVGLLLIIFVCTRFLPILRIIVPITLGFSHLNLYLFTITNFLVSVMWCFFLSKIGIYIGNTTKETDIMKLLNTIQLKYYMIKNIFIYGLLIIIIIFFLNIFYTKYIKK